MGKLPTTDNLLSRNMVLKSEEMLCLFCKRNNESAQNVLLTCDGMYRVCLRCYQWLNLSTVLHESTAVNFRNHLGTLSDKEGIERWKIVWFATLGARGIFATNASLNTSVLMKTNCCRI